MSVKLVKIKEVVYVARCQWACAKDRDGSDIVPYGLMQEHKRHGAAVDVVNGYATKTYKLGDETRTYHAWVERVTRYQDGTEESVVILEHNRPAPESETPESGYTPCACRDCMDTTVSSDMSKPELCSECRDAGCMPLPAYASTDSPRVGGQWDCQRDDAYGEC